MAETRTRKRSFKIDNGKVFARVHTFYKDDLLNRDIDRAVRLERYAKFRMWVGEKDWPWENASNIPLSDMMEQSLRSQDTIHNTVMSSRPIVNASARLGENKDKEKVIDNLIDYQVFEENEGEKLIGDAADAFINDGVLTIFCPWVDETRETADLRLFDPIPEGKNHTEYLKSLVAKAFPKDQPKPVMTSGGWDWTAKDEKDEDINIKFYTKQDGTVEMLVKQMSEVFNGPNPRVIDYDDILHPVRVENLQIPGPSNPGGSSHVILIDAPSIDEIRRLKKKGVYSMLTKEDMKSLANLARNTIDDEEEELKDAVAGQNNEPANKEAKSHNTLTRLTCFDTFDVDGDGVDEDVVFTVILELKKVIKVSFLGELYPVSPPKRPFAEAALIPIRGRRTGISMLEMLEGLHDAYKAIFDQTVDAGTLSLVPFFFYRAAAGVRPEIISLSPGDGYPVTDPNRDINFPQIGNPQAHQFAISFLGLIDQMQEKTTMVGDIQLGRVPPGRSAALRTASGLALLSGQGEARPERILRRFYMAMVQLYSFIHSLNKEFLPRNKQYRIAGFQEKVRDPYRKVESKDDIAGQFDFGFKPSVLNVSKQGLQQSLEVLMQTFIGDLPLQLGIIDADGIYRLMRDFAKAMGQDADAYIKEPQPGAGLRKITAEEAISVILQDGIPEGRPEEPAEVHFEKLQAFIDNPDNAVGMLTPDQQEVFKEYLQKVQVEIQAQAEQAQLQEAANLMSPGGQQQNGGRPPEGGEVDANAATTNPQATPG